MSSPETSAREGALAKLAAEAARFATRPLDDVPDRGRMNSTPIRQFETLPASATTTHAASGPAGYVPVAVAPERGNTRPLVPVDGRLHMRMAKPTVAALDEIVAGWRAHDPSALRDLERATLVRVAVAMLLSDVAQNGLAGATAEAVRAALDPSVRHTDTAMPDLNRWIRASPQERSSTSADLVHADRPVVARYGSQ